MSTELREIINVSLVLLNQGLLQDNDQLHAFQQAVDVDVRVEGGMAADLVTGQTHPSRTIHLDRHRISLSVSRPRSAITKEFPSLAALRSELSLFGEVVEHAFRASGISQVRCDFGYNADMVFDQDTGETALEFLGGRLLNRGALSQPGRRLAGGTCRVVIQDEFGQWNYNFEPRAGDLQRRRLFVGTNLHNEQQLLPGKDEIADSIGKVVNSVIQMMKHLDGADTPC